HISIYSKTSIFICSFVTSLLPYINSVFSDLKKLYSSFIFILVFVICFAVPLQRYPNSSPFGTYFGLHHKIPIHWYISLWHIALLDRNGKLIPFLQVCFLLPFARWQVLCQRYSWYCLNSIQSSFYRTNLLKMSDKQNLLWFEYK